MMRIRRTAQRAAPGPTIVSAEMVDLASLTAIPREVRTQIGSPDQQVCVASIDGPDGRHSLVMDGAWVALAFELHRRPGDLVTGIPLPRAAIRAVIHGWDVTAEPMRDLLRWSDDGIPHVGFPDCDVSVAD